MIFRHFLLDVNESNTFLVGCEETREALLVDLGAWDPAIADFLEEHSLKLTGVFITHNHYDHTDGLAGALRLHSPKVYSGSGIGGGQAVHVSEGDTIGIGRIEGRVVATPGHTPCGVSLVMPGMVFTGDALFAGSVGGTTSAGKARQQIDHIRKGIFSLPEDYEIHVGHGPSSTVRVERDCNPFFV